jgi:hypothetical protein
LAAGFERLRLIDVFEERGFAEARALDMNLDELNLDELNFAEVLPCFMGWVYFPYLAYFTVLGPWTFVTFATLVPWR